MKNKSISIFIFFVLLIFSIGSSFASQSTIIPEVNTTLVELLEEEIKSEKLDECLVSEIVEDISKKSEYIDSEKFFNSTHYLGVDNPPPERA